VSATWPKPSPRAPINSHSRGTHSLTRMEIPLPLQDREAPGQGATKGGSAEGEGGRGQGCQGG